MPSRLTEVADRCSRDWPIARLANEGPGSNVKPPIESIVKVPPPEPGTGTPTDSGRFFTLVTSA